MLSCPAAGDSPSLQPSAASSRVWIFFARTQARQQQPCRGDGSPQGGKWRAARGVWPRAPGRLHRRHKGFRPMSTRRYFTRRTGPACSSTTGARALLCFDLAQPAVTAPVGSRRCPASNSVQVRSWRQGIDGCAGWGGMEASRRGSMDARIFPHGLPQRSPSSMLDADGLSSLSLLLKAAVIWVSLVLRTGRIAPPLPRRHFCG